MFGKNSNDKLDSQIQDLIERLDRQHSKVVNLEESSARFLKAKNEAESKVEKLQNEVADLKARIREQTEADIYLESAMIMKRIEAGEKVKKTDPMVEQQRRLLNKYSGMGGMSLARQAGTIANPHPFQAFGGIV